jgi:membrane protein YqaA with SNARE-associated domain
MLRQLYAFFYHLGGLGLVGLGVLDSSFLFTPFGNDLLIIALTAKHHARMPYYAAMASAGSVAGCLLVDFVCRKGGKEGFEKRVSRKRIKYLERKIGEDAGYALALASLMPPPFPFTPWVMAAAALQYPRKKLLSVIAVTRFVRFCIEGTLAVFFGSSILRLARSDEFKYFIFALLLVSIAGSGYSVYVWVKQSGKHSRARQSGVETGALRE